MSFYVFVPAQAIYILENPSYWYLAATSCNLQRICIQWIHYIKEKEMDNYQEYEITV